jgi:hypothetical protein
MKMARDNHSELNADLMRANLRLGLIAQMAKSNLQEPLTEHEFTEVMRAILDACGPGDNADT